MNVPLTVGYRVNWAECVRLIGKNMPIARPLLNRPLSATARVCVSLLLTLCTFAPDAGYPARALATSITWNTFLGSTGTDNGETIAVDDSGNVYVSGYSDVSWGTPVRAHSGGTDVYVAKLAPGGGVIWSTFLGGSNAEQAGDIAVDAGGNVYVSGVSGASWGTPIRAYSAANDAFVAKLASSGALTWHTFLGGADTDIAGGVAVDGSGNVYTAGHSGATWGTPVRTYTSGFDGFAVKIAGDGSLTWSTFLGGAGTDYGGDVAVDDSGNLYLTGYCNATWGSPIRAFAAILDAVIVKLASNGALTWHTFLGGSDNDIGTGIALDGSGSIYVEGASRATWGTPIEAYTAGYEGYAAKLAGNGTLTWNTFFGGTGVDQGYGIAVDGTGAPLIVGASDATWGTPILPYNSGFDVFAVKLAGDGTRTWSTFIGGSAKDIGRTIASDGVGNIYISGESDGTWGSPVRAFSALDDALVVKVNDADTPGLLTVDTAADSLDGDTSDIDALRTDKGADDRISLREAIIATNNTTGADTIQFTIPLSDSGHVYYKNDGVPDTLSQVVHTTLDDASIPDFDPDYPGGALAGYSWYRIRLGATPLPAITDTLVLDATTQSGFAGKPIVEIDGDSLAGAGNDGLSVTGGGSTIRGFVINRCPGSGIEITASGGNRVKGNFLGTNVTGTYAAENVGQGVHIDGSANNIIGGMLPADRNVLSGNFWRGILIETAGATGNEVKGNYIGTDYTGLSPLQNQIGVYLFEAPGNTIGGTFGGEGNVISGNTQVGVYLVFAGATGNKIQGNTIGLNATRSAPIPNGFAGVEFVQAPGNMLGGSQIGAGNVIAHNDSMGVSLNGDPATDITILSNEIYGHPGLGIDLARDGVTLNDSADIDTGPNDRLNFPVISSAVAIGDTVYVDFELDLPGGNYRIEFFANPAGPNPSGHGEGEHFEDAVNIIHTGSGVETFSHAFAGAAGDTLSATTTECLDPGCTTFASTSEFSQVVAAAGTYDITGRVFEDALIQAGVGEPYNSGQGDTGLSGARVELFDASDVFRTFTTTDAAGNYTFADVTGGAVYKVRVVAASLHAGVGALPEQTFVSDGTSDYGIFGKAMGGQDPLAADTTAQSTMTSAEHWVAISVGAADVTGVDFGFSYELIVNTNDSGQGSFRRFLDNANGLPGVQVSRFNIPTTDPNHTSSPLAYTIQPDSSLSPVIDPTIVSGTSQPDYTTTPVIVLDGALAGAGVSGLQISAGGSTVRALNIRRFTVNGIYITAGGGNTIVGNYIGTDATGLLDRGNGANGIHIDADTGGNTIGGTLAGLRNVISGNGTHGIHLQATSANFVRGNYIGVDKNGSPNLGNDGHGILIDGGDDNAIGGTAPGEGNLISGNAGSGVAVTG